MLNGATWERKCKDNIRQWQRCSICCFDWVLIWVRNLKTLDGCWTKGKQYDSKYDLSYTKPHPLAKRGLAKSVHGLKIQVMSRWSTMQVVVHTLSSVPLTVSKDSTSARSPLPSHMVRYFFPFLVSLSQHCVLLSNIAVFVVLFHVFFYAVSFETVFSQKCFSPHRRQTPRTQKLKWYVARFSSIYYLYCIIFCQNHKTMLPSQQQKALPVAKS